MLDGDPVGRALREKIARLEAEVARLQDVKRRTLAIADERAIEAVKARAENERLRRFLEIAVDAHDDTQGEVNPEKMPNHWTVQARKMLGHQQKEKTDG